MAVVELFRALGDASRLEMIRRLSSGDVFTINSLSEGLDITRQGARKHLQILADAQLVTLVPKGRGTNIQMNREMLDQGRAFIADLEHRWDIRLEALRRFVDNE